MRRRGWALVGGALAYGTTFYRFLSYAERNREGFTVLFACSALSLFIGFIVGLGATPNSERYIDAVLIIVGVLVAHAAVIAVDLSRDPTTHNLLPLEFPFMAIVASPALIGAAAAHLADRLRARR
jgi:hypothetical protein